jgi:hypothetical protein
MHTFYGGTVMRNAILILLAGAFLVVSGCGGGGPTTPDINASVLLGDWIGTYQNDVVGTGSIELTFFQDSGVLKVTYDLQNGEVTGTSNVGIDGREITFIGVGTKLKLVKGLVSKSGGGISGSLTIDYTLYGTRSGELDLTKI